MDRNRDLSKQLARVETKLQEQMDLDYARHGVSIVEDDYTTAITGDFYGIKADGEGTAGLVTSSITIDGVTITIPITIANGDTFYGNITAVTFNASSSANAILLHKKGHGPSAAITLDMGYGNGMAGSKKMIRKPAIRKKMYSKEFSTFYTNFASTNGSARVRWNDSEGVVGGVVVGTIAAKKGYPFCYFTASDGSVTNKKFKLRTITADSVSRGSHLVTFNQS